MYRLDVCVSVYSYFTAPVSSELPRAAATLRLRRDGRYHNPQRHYLTPIYSEHCGQRLSSRDAAAAIISDGVRAKRTCRRLFSNVDSRQGRAVANFANGKGRRLTNNKMGVDWSGEVVRSLEIRSV